MKIISVLSSLLRSRPAPSAQPPTLKSVPLDDFMHGQIEGALKLPIPVPVSYEAATIPSAPVGYAYWMQPSDVSAAAASGDLPAEHGYMYGKISLDVAYDETQRIFVGVEDPAMRIQIKKDFSSVSLERFTYGDHPVLLASLATRDLNKLVYAMYVGLNIASNTVYVALRPPGNSKDIGDYIWGQLRTLLRAGPAQTWQRAR